MLHGRQDTRNVGGPRDSSQPVNQDAPSGGPIFKLIHYRVPLSSHREMVLEEADNGPIKVLMKRGSVKPRRVVADLGNSLGQ